MEDKKEEIYDEKTQTFPNCETENCKQQEPIFVMTLELDEGNPKQIQIFSDSKPGELAFQFCKDNNLDFESLEQLKIQIENLMKEHIKEEPLYEEKKNQDAEIIKENHCEPLELENIEENKVLTSNEKIERYTPLYQKNNNLKIQHPNETYTKSISISKHLQNPLSRSITDTHKSSNVKKSSKLFPYEFKIEDNRANIRNNKNTSKVNQSYQSLRARSAANSNHGVSISRISTMNSQSKSKKSIFDRLFKDSQIKRIAHRRPCHFSNTPSKRNSITSYNNTNTSINTISLMNNHYDYFSDEEYARSYQLKSSKERKNNFSFRPNIAPLSSKKSITLQSTYSLINYRPKIIEKKPLQDKDRYNNYHTIKTNGLYRPLRDRVVTSSQEESTFLDEIRRESYTNLYIALCGDENEKLSKSNLNIVNVPQNIQNDIQSIIQKIKKVNAIYTKEDFINEMKEIFKSLSFEEKRNIINYYKMRTSKQPIERNCITPSLFNSKTSSQMNSSRKSLSCSKNKETMRRLKELRNPSNKKRNFYYIFS